MSMAAHEVVLCCEMMNRIRIVDTKETSAFPPLLSLG